MRKIVEELKRFHVFYRKEKINEWPHFPPYCSLQIQELASIFKKINLLLLLLEHDLEIQ